jgi:serine/threonine protein kinase
MNKSEKIFNNRYKKISKIGEGSFGKIYLAQDLKPDPKAKTTSGEQIFCEFAFLRSNIDGRVKGEEQDYSNLVALKKSELKVV